MSSGTSVGGQYLMSPGTSVGRRYLMNSGTSVGRQYLVSPGASVIRDPYTMQALQRQQGGSFIQQMQKDNNSAGKNSGAVSQSQTIPLRQQDGRSAAQQNAVHFFSVLSGKDTEHTGAAAGVNASSASAADVASRLEEYTKYLRSKYGNLTIKSVGKDKKTLEGLGKSMSGNDVVIAPNILEEMAGNPEKAAYYEGKIDAFFEDIPRQKALFAAKGLDYQPCGVVVHEDGSVTYIGGCADSPERVAQVNAINKVKREKQAAERKAALERSREAAKMQRALTERYLTEKAFSVSMMPGVTPKGGQLL